MAYTDLYKNLYEAALEEIIVLKGRIALLESAKTNSALAGALLGSEIGIRTLEARADDAKGKVNDTSK